MPLDQLSKLSVPLAPEARLLVELVKEVICQQLPSPQPEVPAPGARGEAAEDTSVLGEPSEPIRNNLGDWKTNHQRLPKDSATVTPEQGLIVAEFLQELHLDHVTWVAAILYASTYQTELLLTPQQREQLGDLLINLVQGARRMDAIGGYCCKLPSRSNHRHNLDNLRKMLLAMVDDIRVVIIRLVGQLARLRAVPAGDLERRKLLAQETMDIYAPLANRLGIARIKWELEDLAFKFLEAGKYRQIAADIRRHFPHGDQYIHTTIHELRRILTAAGIAHFQVTGRTKHIYSIYRKMLRKNTEFAGIYDISALRVFVPNIEDCYAGLSAVHNAWRYLPEEFDDYIAAPKANGYRSIHTAVYGPRQRVVEIQIRTYAMHKEAELGVAAHWVYKEGGAQGFNYQAKLAWLRQVMDWQQEVVKSGDSAINLQQLFDEYVYVFTPHGDIWELPKGATPLDFAYRIHSELGHRCIGAKINGKITPLAYPLQMGDRVEILTARASQPRRDWLVPGLGFLRTPRARAKVAQWFKRQSYADHLIGGQELVERESRRLHLGKLDLKLGAERLGYKSGDDLVAALGRGDLKFSAILHELGITEERKRPKAGEVAAGDPDSLVSSLAPRISISGVNRLLVRTARCCHPVPGDPIVGYLTQSRGIVIHHADCLHLRRNLAVAPQRQIEANWG